MIGIHLSAEESRNASLRNRIRGAPQSPRRDVEKFHAVFDQELKRRDVFIRPHANQVSIAESELLVLVVGVVEIDLVRRIRDPVLLLQTRPSAKWDITSAQHGVSADIDVLVDGNDGDGLITRRNRRAQSRGAGPGNDDVGFPIPSRRDLSVRFLQAESGHCRGAEASGSAFQKTTTIE